MNELPFLDERLSLIASLVRCGSVVADIGADHGYLVTWLVKQGICRRGFACDINEMPLARSRRTVEQYGVADRVQLVLSNGLEHLRESDADDIVIAGMGGDLISQILAAAGWKSREKRYLLQPMTRADELRRWLCANGYEILCEHCARANRFRYTVMTVRYTGEVIACGDLFAVVGRLPECGTEDARSYIRWQAEIVLKKIGGLRASKDRTEQAAPFEILYRDILRTIGEDKL